MQTLFTKDTKTITKDTKTINEIIKKKEKAINLFGLGSLSLIAACSSVDTSVGNSKSDGDDDNNTKDDDPSGNSGKPFQSEVLLALPEVKVTDNEVSVAITTTGVVSGAAMEAQITTTVDGGQDLVSTISFAKGTTADAGIYKITGTGYDAVFSSSTFDRETSDTDFQKGKIFIYWGVDGTTSFSSHHLEIKGGAAGEFVGSDIPKFLQISGKDGEEKHDMVITSRQNDSEQMNAGAIYILWDVPDYAGGIELIDLGSLTADATFGSLAIYGTTDSDGIGADTPTFFQLGGEDNNHDMVIRSQSVNVNGVGEAATDAKNEGAIYVLWDVDNYYSTTDKNQNINLNSHSTPDVIGATAGSLTIYGGKSNDGIGIYESDFLQIAGASDSDEEYDMVIRSRYADKVGNNTGSTDEGAIFILWDVADHYDTATLNKTVVLDSTATGLLSIKGAADYDQIGSYAPEFLQIGGKDDNYDMVIRSHTVDKNGTATTNTNQGAIYVLWDVADYYNTSAANQNVDIELTPNSATSGLLTIYGRAVNSELGSDDNNVLYATDSNGNKALTNVDEGHAGDNGKDDLVFTDADYTYVIFGDKISTTGTDDKVDSKTIDLATVEGLLGNGNAGFFDYDFDGPTTASDPAVDKVGYRFVGNKADLAAVQADFPDPTTPLSDADADLGVWDIA